MRSRKPLAERLLPGCDSVISDRAGSLQTIVRFGRMPVIAESNHRDIIELPFEKKTEQYAQHIQPQRFCDGPDRRKQHFLRTLLEK